MRRTTTMADALSMALTDLLRKHGVDGDLDFLRERVRLMTQRLMELEVEEQLGAGRYERTVDRTGQRNGYRERQWDTRVGSIALSVPRIRHGGYLPTLLEPR